MSDRLNDVFALLQERLKTAERLTVSEPFVAQKSPEVGGPLQTLTLAVSDKPLALLCLTSTEISLKKTSLVNYSSRRARARKLPYLVLGNGREFFIANARQKDDVALETLKQYPSLIALSSKATEPLAPTERLAVEQFADHLATDLLALHRDGRLGMVTPDAEFLINRLTRAVNTLKPAVKSALQTQLAYDPKFVEELTNWALLQGIAADLRSPEFAEAVVRQAIYRLLGKIIFYQSLRRAATHLPELNLDRLDTSEVMPRLQQCFSEAHKIDYHAVFDDQNVVDRLPFPKIASAELRDLVSDLNTRDFAHLPQDVVGAVFERLIPPEDRLALGQFFTPEPLVDLIVGFCVRNSSDYVLDPTCGTGTFLIRAYDRLQTRLGVYDHSRLLGQLWGVDVAPFPAELATINLFRQNIGETGNFPRILNEDFFDILPNGIYRFPPLTANELQAIMVDEPIPIFDVIVGNFPYISADRIEKTVKDYRHKMNRRLAEEWLKTYDRGFEFPKKADEKQFQLAREQGLDISLFVPKAESVISEFADLYVSLFWHAAAFLRPGGRMGIVTSNAWLDVAYGYALQRFFLDHFKIIAVLESRCEPWFEQAAVNTVVTVLERCESRVDRDQHTARFVQVKRPLAQLIPQDMHLESLNRWLHIEALSQRIEAVQEAFEDPAEPKTSEDDNFRIRSVRQGSLRTQVDSIGQVVKWGHYLRAPQVYFDLHQLLGDKLVLLRDIAPISRGSLTGINEFYHLDEEALKRWNIEEEFVWPVLKSPGDSDRILIDPAELKLKVFICRLTKDELRARGKLNALRYIEWGEQQVFAGGAQAGQTWPHGAEVRNRKPGWYALPAYRGRLAQLFFASAYGERHIHKYSSEPLIADKRLYFLSPVEGVDYTLVAAVINSSLVSLFLEVAGRVTLGDGALELTVEDASDHLLIPDVRQFDSKSRQATREAFQSLLRRSIGTIFEEVQRNDRQALDTEVLRALGLKPQEWLEPIYGGLTMLVRERTQLGRMRGQSRRGRPQKAASRVIDEVIADLLPNGPLRFPDAFLPPNLNPTSLREIPLPESRLRLKGHWLGKEELSTDTGQTLHVATRFEAHYLIYAQANGHRVVRIPTELVEISRAVKTYVQYLWDLRARMQQAYFTRTLDHAAADRFVSEVWKRFSLPDIEG